MIYCMACKEGSTELKNKLYCMYRCRIRCGQTGWGFCWVLQKMLSCSSPSCDLSLTTYMWVPPCVKWFMYMLNKLSHGDFFLRNCGILKSVLVAFFFLLSHCQAESMQMDELYCHCHICSSAPIGLIQLLHRRSLFCQKHHDMSVYTKS